MPGVGRFRLSSLRFKLGAAALVGLITTLLLTGLLLFTAGTASDMVNTARLTHERVRVYSQLHTASRDYQGMSYSSVRDPGSHMQSALVTTRKRLEEILEAAAGLPAKTPRDRALSQRIQEQGRAVLARFRNAPALVSRVDKVWREQGSRAALKEVSRISAPVYALEATLQKEIHRGDVVVAHGTARALDLIQIAVIGSFVGLLLGVSFSVPVQMLLHLRLRPGLRRLENGAQAFGAGNLDHRIGLTGKDELSQLSTAFDRMAETIAEKQAALHEVQLALERTVAARTEELQRANGELSAVDERRRAFLADVSHELRTPLTVIRGETQVALRTADQPGFDPHDVFERILQQTHDLSRMVDDLFLIARAEVGGLPLHREMLDLRDIATRVACDFETLASETGGSIRACGMSDVAAFVDPDRLRRALAALIENALRHCQPGVNVELDVQMHEDCAVIAVCDDGPGIAPAIAQQLFERFRRGETRGEGSGLGLSLVSALVEAHGGRAYLEARHGGGTRAVMRFPVPAPEQVAA
jgi:signal transduction histidine kinase